MLKLYPLLFSAFTLFITAISSQAQNAVQDLGGFRLGQYQIATHNEFGDPNKKGATDADVSYEAFLLKEDPTVYMVFQYQNREPEIIWSIQITGWDEKFDPGFNGLRFGLSPKEVENRLGRPARKIDIGEHGTRWEFEGRNVSIEIDTKGRLSSIRIVDERSEGPQPDLKRLPNFTELIKRLQTGTNAELADLLEADMELYDAGKVRSFERAMGTEIASDQSGIFGAIRRLSKELSTVDMKKPDQYEENMRMRYGRDSLHVIKLFKTPGISEIAFRWNGAKWLIWEFGKGKPEPNTQAWKQIYTPGSLKNIVATRMPELLKNPNVALTKDNGKPLASFSYNSYPTSTGVKFTGESRKTPETTVSLIALWLTTIGKPKDLAKSFEFEYKFSENGVDYWLPVQSPLHERFLKDTKKDDQITIYFSWVGIKYENDRPELLAVLNEFTTGNE